jgi:hypothetical protein
MTSENLSNKNQRNKKNLSLMSRFFVFRRYYVNIRARTTFFNKYK